MTTVQYCCNSSDLHKVVLGKNVSQIRTQVFSNANIQEFTITGEEPPYCYPNIFGTKDLSGATLYVPEDKISYYQATEPWSKFGTIKTLNGETPAPPAACGKPTISYSNGQLQFSDETEGTEYHYTISCADVQSDVLSTDGKVDLVACYNISAYATASGYTQSATATATLYWVKADGNLTIDNINSARMRGVVVSSDNGFVRLSGLTDGEKVMFYSVDGKVLGSQNAKDGTAGLATSEPVVICKMGETSIKVQVK